MFAFNPNEGSSFSVILSVSLIVEIVTDLFSLDLDAHSPSDVMTEGGKENVSLNSGMMGLSWALHPHWSAGLVSKEARPFQLSLVVTPV